MKRSSAGDLFGFSTGVIPLPVDPPRAAMKPGTARGLWIQRIATRGGTHIFFENSASLRGMQATSPMAYSFPLTNKGTSTRTLVEGSLSFGAAGIDEWFSMLGDSCDGVKTERAGKCKIN